jgi:hypothetical protein
MNPNARMGLVAAVVVVGSLAVIVGAIVVANVSRPDPAPAKLPDTKQSAKQQPAKRPAEAERETAETIQGVAAGSVAIGLVLLLIVVAIAYMVLVFGVMVWVARDAYNRGHEGALWAIIYIVPHLLVSWPYSLIGLVMAATIIGLAVWIPVLFPVVALSWSGLPVYLCSRRRGVLAVCQACGLKHLEYVARCPHCAKSVA